MQKWSELWESGNGGILLKDLTDIRFVCDFHIVANRILLFFSHAAIIAGKSIVCKARLFAYICLCGDHRRNT